MIHWLLCLPGLVYALCASIAGSGHLTEILRPAVRIIEKGREAAFSFQNDRTVPQEKTLCHRTTFLVCDAFSSRYSCNHFVTPTFTRLRKIRYFRLSS